MPKITGQSLTIDHVPSTQTLSNVCDEDANDEPIDSICTFEENNIEASYNGRIQIQLYVILFFFTVSI
jgi:hypothetical protein